MARAKYLLASLLLAAGIVLVFAGLSSALGYTASGMLGSVAAIAALLYAGGIWFGAPAPSSLHGAALTFDHRLHLTTGAPAPSSLDGAAVSFDHRLHLTTGAPLLPYFPEPLRAEIRVHCLAALAGERARFTAGGRAFQAVPVVDADGVVIYGMLIEGAPASRPSVA